MKMQVSLTKIKNRSKEMQERMKILEMLKDGIITVDEAEDLLKTIDSVDEETVPQEEVTKNNNLRMFKIKVTSHKGDNVNISIPVAFLKAAIASGNIDNIVNKSVKINGVDHGLISENIDVDMLIACIDNDYVGNLVDVTTSQGDIVKIYFE